MINAGRNAHDDVDDSTESITDSDYEILADVDEQPARNVRFVMPQHVRFFMPHEEPEDEQPARNAPVVKNSSCIGEWGDIFTYVPTFFTAAFASYVIRNINEKFSDTCLSNTLQINLLCTTYLIDLSYRVGRWAITGENHGIVSDLMNLGQSFYRPAPALRAAGGRSFEPHAGIALDHRR
jgi:hypothetical protein